MKLPFAFPLHRPVVWICTHCLLSLGSIVALRLRAQVPLLSTRDLGWIGISAFLLMIMTGAIGLGVAAIFRRVSRLRIDFWALAGSIASGALVFLAAIMIVQIQ